MHSEMQQIGKYMRAHYANVAPGSLWMGTASTSNLDLDFPGQVIDRLAFSRRYRGALAFASVDLTVASSALLTLEAGIQDAAATSGPWADVARSTGLLVGTAVSSDAAPIGAAPQVGVDLSGAKRYIRPVFKLKSLTGATSSGQAALATLGLILAGADELPVDSFVSNLLAQG